MLQLSSLLETKLRLWNAKGRAVGRKDFLQEHGSFLCMLRMQTLKERAFMYVLSVGSIISVSQGLCHAAVSRVSIIIDSKAIF